MVAAIEPHPKSPGFSSLRSFQRVANVADGAEVSLGESGVIVRQKGWALKLGQVVESQAICRARAAIKVHILHLEEYILSQNLEVCRQEGMFRAPSPPPCVRRSKQMSTRRAPASSAFCETVALVKRRTVRGTQRCCVEQLYLYQFFEQSAAFGVVDQDLAYPRAEVHLQSPHGG